MDCGQVRCLFVEPVRLEFDRTTTKTDRQSSSRLRREALPAGNNIESSPKAGKPCGKTLSQKECKGCWS